jgi:hypothetical protein
MSIILGKIQTKRKIIFSNIPILFFSKVDFVDLHGFANDLLNFLRSSVTSTLSHVNINLSTQFSKTLKLSFSIFKRPKISHPHTDSRNMSNYKCTCIFQCLNL